LQSAQPFQTFIRPGPIGILQSVRRNSFPQSRITNSADAELCKKVEVFGTILVSVFFELVVIIIADAIDRAFDSAQSSIFFFILSDNTIVSIRDESVTG
jgi:hypothetical protein